jgi:uncharacterized protein (TIGR03435 family)
MARILLLILAGLGYAQPAFETVSIKPSTQKGLVRFQSGDPALSVDELVWRSCSLQLLMLQAFDIQQYQLSMPGSMERYYFDLVAKLPQGTNRSQIPLMMQTLLADRFRLVIRREQKEKQVYELVVAEGGPKFHEAGTADPAGSDPDDEFEGMPGGFLFKPGRIQMKRQPIGNLVNTLTMAMQSSKPVIDATGLKAKYDLTLTWTDQRSRGGENSNALSIAAAIQSQLGLKLKEEKRPIEIIAVEHVRKPAMDK